MRIKTAALLLFLALPHAGRANFEGSDEFTGPEIDPANWEGWSSETDYRAFCIQTGELTLNMDWDGGGSSEVAGGMIWKPNFGAVDQDWELSFDVEVPQFSVVTESQDYHMHMRLDTVGTDPTLHEEYGPRLSLSLNRRWDGSEREFRQTVQAYFSAGGEDDDNIEHEFPEEVTKTCLKLSWDATASRLSALYKLDDGNDWWNLLGTWNIQSGAVLEPDGVFAGMVEGELDGFRGLPNVLTPRASLFLARPYRSGSGGGTVTGDYDGDGTCDLAVFRPGNGLWKVRNITQAYFGGSSYTPVPHDYDGDGTWDLAYFRDGSGLWKVRGITAIYFGVSEDSPVPGDYDGDGMADLGYFRAPDKLWKIKGLTRVYFGASGDSPVSY